MLYQAARQWSGGPINALLFGFSLSLLLLFAGLYANTRRSLKRLVEEHGGLTESMLASTVERSFMSPLDPLTSFALCADALSGIGAAEAIGYGEAANFRHDQFANTMSLARGARYWFPPVLHVKLRQRDNGLTVVQVRRTGGYEWFRPQTGEATRELDVCCTLLMSTLQRRRDEMDAAKREKALEQAALQARLAALQAQVEPHFLFNTLANLKHLIRADQARAQEMVDHLVGYLQVAIPDMRAVSSTVGSECALAEHYLAIMQIRMGARLAYRIELPEDCAGLPMPPAMLISLVENAVKHGLERATRKGLVVVQVVRAGPRLILSVSDDGAGLQDQLGQGVGLANIAERLRLLYADAASLTVEPNTAGGVRSSLNLPCAT